MDHGWLQVPPIPGRGVGGERGTTQSFERFCVDLAVGRRVMQAVSAFTLAAVHKTWKKKCFNKRQVQTLKIVVFSFVEWTWVFIYWLIFAVNMCAPGNNATFLALSFYHSFITLFIYSHAFFIQPKSQCWHWSSPFQGKAGPEQSAASNKPLLQTWHINVNNVHKHEIKRPTCKFYIGPDQKHSFTW